MSMVWHCHRYIQKLVFSAHLKKLQHYPSWYATKYWGIAYQTAFEFPHLKDQRIAEGYGIAL